MPYIILSILILFINAAAFGKTVKLTPGLVINKSVTITKGTYRFSAPASLDSAVIIIRGDNITVDFSGSVLDGSRPGADPDMYSGVGIRIENGSKIKIKNAVIRGYRFGILARDVHGLDLVNNDVSDSWKPRLFSGPEHESLIDWLSFHRNDNNEWLRYGAGIYLLRVSEGDITRNTGEHGMNGLLMVQCDRLNIHSNNFSFNSGLGIGLYRSSSNKIVHNKLDFNIRGYSHGVYARGQDSADLLLYEQSDSNVVAYNSCTHGGDGLFLWAGQTTMDSGKGGANDNLFFGNDFSFAPANGIEATFSRNMFIANHVEGNNYGVWGGFSFESEFSGNDVLNNRIGIAIEHGQDNHISSNRFTGDTTAVFLWANPIGASDWGYPKYRETSSRNYTIDHNVIEHARRGLRVFNTDTLIVHDNSLFRVDTATVFRDTLHVVLENNPTLNNGILHPPALPARFAALAPKVPSNEAHIPTSDLMHRDRSVIIVDEWGPYDWRKPGLFPLPFSIDSVFRLRVAGPAGTWKFLDRRGIASLSATSGKIGDTIIVRPTPESMGDWNLVLEYSSKGAKKEQFSFNRFAPIIDWNIGFFTWTDSLTDPQTKPQAFDSLLHSAPIVALHSPHLDYEWYRPAIKGLPDDHYAALATGTVTLPEGSYTLSSISDDAMRLWVDDKLLIDNWKPHESAIDYAPITGGSHKLRVEYVQVDGYAEFRVDILKGSSRSSGSPSPHGN